jgi:hypothetical protein
LVPASLVSFKLASAGCELLEELHSWSCFFPFFLAWWSLFFAGGFAKSGVQNVVFLMVKSWWNAGERWSENDLRLTSNNTPLSFDLFLEFPVLGERDLRRGLLS